MIDFGKETEVNTRVLIYELLDFVDDVIPVSYTHLDVYKRQILIQWNLL